MKRILVVDDELGPRESLKAIFSGTYAVTTAGTAANAEAILSKENVDLVLLDVMMPGKDGIALLRDLQDLYPTMPVIMISASSSVRRVVEAMRVGAFDYVTKPFDVEEMLHTARRALASTSLHRRVEVLETEVAREFPVDGIVGRSEAFVAALDDLRKVAVTDATVLVRGESGTGKELAARMLHSLSNRADEPFVAVHCASLSESLMESELFGHEKGAFTNADAMKPGRFDLAGSGTLFFDEVGEMTASTQVKLLRVLQEREFMRVGGTRVIPTNARIVAATARNLRTEVAEGRFREDLFYRLSVVPLSLPPLRERTGDIPLLVEWFVNYFRESVLVETRGFDEESMTHLCAYSWPGNVRELRNIVERMLVLHGRRTLITVDCLPDEFDPGTKFPMPGVGQRYEEALGAYERELIQNALRQTDGVQTRAAELLGTTRRKLRYRMDRLNISGAGEQTEGPGAGT